MKERHRTSQDKADMVNQAGGHPGQGHKGQNQLISDVMIDPSDDEDGEKHGSEGRFAHQEQSQLTPPDGGWGWMVVLAVFLEYALYGGLVNGYGLVYVEIQRHFNSSAALTAWIGATQYAIMLALSPLATYLAQRFTTRRVVMLGGVITGLGIMLSAFVPRAEYLFFTYTLMAGCGTMLMFGPSLVLIGEYFTTKKGLAYGIAGAGIGFGTPGMAVILRKLFSTYGYHGTMIILGAIYFNFCVSGALMRQSNQTHEQESPGVSGPKPRYLDKRHGDLLRKLGSSYLSINASTSHLPSDDVIEPVGSSPTPEQPACSGCISVKFVSLIISFALFNVLATGVYIMLAAHSLNLGLTDDHAALLVSILGACSIFGRLSSGLLDVKRLRPYKKHIYLGGVVWSTCMALGCAFSTNLLQLIITVTLFELVDSAMFSTYSLLVSDSVEPARLGTAFGLGMMSQGIALTTGQAFAGWLRDYTGSYIVSFAFFSSCGLAAAVVFFVGGILFHHIEDHLKKITERKDGTNSRMIPSC